MNKNISNKREAFEKALEKTGELAMEEARKSGRADAYIVYMKDGKMLKEYVDGRIEEIKGVIED